MRDIPTLITALNTAIWELGEAMTDFPDKDLWTRPHENLLSTGELLTHLIGGETSVFLGPNYEHPLLNSASDYYPHNLNNPFQNSLTAADMYAELKQIHQECINAYQKIQPLAEDRNPFRDQWSWGEAIEYMVFHFAYHTGQIYSLRHILGHQTVDN